MKKKLGILFLCGCFIGVSACGSQETHEETEAETITTENPITETITTESTTTENSITDNITTETISEFRDYEDYEGIWSVDGINHESILTGGGAELVCLIENGNGFSGSLFTQQSETERFALIEDISGIIENDELYFEFLEDGWGGTGTLYIRFVENKIMVEVLDYQIDKENSTGYGINNSYEMIRVTE